MSVCGDADMWGGGEVKWRVRVGMDAAHMLYPVT